MAALLLLIRGPSAWATPVTAEDACVAVQAWVDLDPAPLGAGLGATVSDVETFTDEQLQPVYYVVYLDPSGFVIVSADDKVEPIIAFSPEGTYDPATSSPLATLLAGDLPGRAAAAQMSQAVNALSAAPEILAEGTGGASMTPKEKWARLLGLRQPPMPYPVSPQSMGLPLPDAPTDVRVAPLIQSRWAQKYLSAQVSTSSDNVPPDAVACYNYFTPLPGPSWCFPECQQDSITKEWHYVPAAPKGDPRNCVCGCVATAAAQLIRYHQYPTQGIGMCKCIYVLKRGGYNEIRFFTWGGNGFGSPYDWTQMPLDPQAEYLNGCITARQRQAIGALCYDIGIACSMAYEPGGSGAEASDIKPALMAVFAYASAVLGQHNTGESMPPGLHTMLNSNLDAGLPCMLSINSYLVGHEILADGYGFDFGTLYHHLNMGWAGSFNIWYNLPSIPARNRPFDTVFDCTYNIFPDFVGEIISGRVVDSLGEGIAGAIVIAHSPDGGTYTTTTGDGTGPIQRGIYALKGLPSNTQFSISVSAAGYTFRSRTVTTGTSVDGPHEPGNQWGVDFGNIAALPPVAQASSPIAFVNHSATFTLDALSNGVPAAAGLLTYSVQSLPASGTLADPNGGTIAQQQLPYRLLSRGCQVVYTPVAGFTGPDAFSFTARDGAGGESAAASVSITVAPLPVLEADNSLVRVEQTGATISLQTTQPLATAAGVVRYVIASVPQYGQLRDYPKWDPIGHGPLITSESLPYTLGRESWMVAYTAGASFPGNDQFTFKCTDGLVESDEATITLGGGAPLASDSAVETFPGASVSTKLLASDDGFPNPPGNLRYYITSLPAGGTLYDSNGQVISSSSSMPYELPAQLPGHTTEVRYYPSGMNSYEDEFKFKVSDSGSAPSGGDSNEATVSISVAPLADPHPPTVRDTCANARSGVPLTIELPVKDDGYPYPITLSITALPQHGTIGEPDEPVITQDQLPYFLTDGDQLVYTPGAEYIGSDSFTFVADDGGSAPTGGATTATFTIAVDAQTPPTAWNTVGWVRGVCPNMIILHATDDGFPHVSGWPGTLNYTITSLPTHGVLRDAEGNLVVQGALLPNTSDPDEHSYSYTYTQVSYTCTDDYTGEDTFTFRANDGGTAPTGGDSGAGTITVRIMPAEITSPVFLREGQTGTLRCTTPIPNGQSATYTWTQLDGAEVTPAVGGITTNEVAFTVPALTYTTDTPLRFHVHVTVSGGTNGQAASDIIVPVYMNGDVGHDGYVNVGDLQLLVAAWGSRLVDPQNGGFPSMHWNPGADLNDDGFIQVGDLQTLVANWGRKLIAPPPEGQSQNLWAGGDDSITLDQAGEMSPTDSGGESVIKVVIDADGSSLVDGQNVLDVHAGDTVTVKVLAGADGTGIAAIAGGVKVATGSTAGTLTTTAGSWTWDEAWQGFLHQQVDENGQLMFDEFGDPIYDIVYPNLTYGSAGSNGAWGSSSQYMASVRLACGYVMEPVGVLPELQLVASYQVQVNETAVVGSRVTLVWANATAPMTGYRTDSATGGQTTDFTQGLILNVIDTP